MVESRKGGRLCDRRTEKGIWDKGEKEEKEKESDIVKN